MAKPRLVHLIANISGKGVRTDYLEGEEYLVAPVAMMVEGVHNGSQGKLLYEEEELDRWSPAWNHKPIVVDHPESGPACTQAFLNTHKVGILLGTRFERRKQRAEAWFHKKRTAMIEPRIIDVLNNQKQMEVSTGLYVELEGGPGTFHGERYKAKAVNHKPDHLAILPDSVGACSIKKGAGLMQFNRESGKRNKKGAAMQDGSFKITNREGLLTAIKAINKSNDRAATMQHIRKRAKALGLMSLLPDAWKGVNNRLRKASNRIMDVVLNTKERKMLKSKKRKFVDGLIKNELTRFEDKDRKWLMSLNAEQLRALEPEKPKFVFSTQEELDEAVQEGIASSIQDPKLRKKLMKQIKNETEDEDEDDPVENDDEEEEDDVVDNADDMEACVVSYMKGNKGCSKAEAIAACKKKMTKNQKAKQEAKPKAKNLKEFLKHDVPPELRPILNQALSHARREHERLVKIILKNENNVFEEDDLMAMDLEQLKGMAALAAGSDNDDERHTSYFGAATGADLTDNEEDEDEEVLELPTYNADRFGRDGKRKRKLVAAGMDEDDEDDE